MIRHTPREPQARRAERQQADSPLSMPFDPAADAGDYTQPSCGDDGAPDATARAALGRGRDPDPVAGARAQAAQRRADDLRPRRGEHALDGGADRAPVRGDDPKRTTVARQLPSTRP